MIVGLKVDEQLVHLIEHFFRTSVTAVNLVDDHDCRQVQRKRLLQNVTSLRKRSFSSVNEQQNAVNHREGALNFSTKVGVTRSVDQVDLGVLVNHRSGFSQNGDSSLTFLIIRVHDTIDHRLVSSKSSGCPQQSVHESCFSMVDVRD